jgi:hypothetical protein
MALPNTFATQPTGNVPASFLDANFAAVQIQGTQAVVATGVANAYVATPSDALSPSYSAYRNRGFYVSFPATNTGASTINFSGLGVTNILKLSGGALVPLAAGDITVDVPNLLICNGTNFILYGAQSSFASNILDNVSGAVYQRTVAATSDNTYFADRWVMLTQTASVTPSVLSSPEDAFARGIRITQTQVAAQRFGYLQVVESINCLNLRNAAVAASARVRISNSQAVRYAILAWTGTADTLGASRDVVNDWTSATYTNGNFFISSSLTIVAVGASTPSANTWTTLPTITGTAPAGANNLLLFVWTEGTAAQNVTLDFDYNWLNQGGAIGVVQQRPIQQELAICARYLPSVAFESSSGGRNYPGIGFSTTQASVSIALTTQPRTRLTGAVVTDATFFFLVRASGGIATTAIAFENHVGTLPSAQVTATVASGIASDLPVHLGTNTGSSLQKIIFTGAEL